MNVLKGLLAERGITQKELADRMNISEKTVVVKVNNYKKWSVSETEQLKEILQVDTIDELFFKK